MGDLLIEGGKPLKGSVRIQGSKNAALPIMAAALLCHGETLLKNCPKISDVFYMEKILNALGAKTGWEAHDLYLDCTEIDGKQIQAEYAGVMRSSILLLGPLLARLGSAEVGLPGGCVIGKRPIDLHLKLLEQLGAEIEEKNNRISARSKGLKGTQIRLSKCSVGATEQGILSAVCADGKTVLSSCAREPEIVHLCRFLRKAGAQIWGEGTEHIEIYGKKGLKAVEFEIPADRIVAGTYICAAAATRGKIELESAPVMEMKAFLEVYEKMGGQYQQKSGKLVTDSVNMEWSVPFLQTEAYPGFPTDLQSPLLALLTTIDGKSRVRENIFENRFQITCELVKMGAEIQIEGNDAVIKGGLPLKGCEVCAGELRGGAALLVAALAAEGNTRIKGYSYIRRGYEDICKDIAALGGRIRESTG